MSDEPIRLQKLLSERGFASRRNVEEMITQGRITVNGQVSILGDKASDDDDVRVDGIRIKLDATKVYFLLNKPEGVISTTNDDLNRTNVTDLVETNIRVFPVGRLDANTTGLIILTNDGKLTQLLTHPSHGVDKKYISEVEGEISKEDVEKLRNGIELEDGVTSPAKVKTLAKTKEKSLLEIIIHEGRNRQIRRMCDAVNHPVITLTRVAIGPLTDPDLKLGEYRELSAKEVFELYEAAENN